jgi:site-specific recombinase XerD
MAIRAVPPKRSSGRTGKLFKLAKIVKPDGTPKRCHPHMFRDTFAVELLVGGCASRSSVTAVGPFQREDY